MKSTLDNCDGIILDNLNFQNEDELIIKISELILSDSKTDLNFSNGNVIKGLNPLELRTESRQFTVNFKGVAFYQVVDESYCYWDNYDIRDGKYKLQELIKSRYLDFINDNFPFYSNLDKSGTHYRLITSDQVIDIICFDKPTILEL